MFLCCLPGKGFAKVILIILTVQFLIHLAAYFNGIDVNERILLIGNMLSLGVLFVINVMWPIFRRTPGIDSVISALYRRRTPNKSDVAIANAPLVAAASVNVLEPCDLQQWTKNFEALMRQAPTNEFESGASPAAYDCGKNCRYSRAIFQSAYIDASGDPRVFREAVFIDHDQQCPHLGKRRNRK